MPREKKRRPIKSRLLSIGILVSSPVSFAVTGPSPLTFTLLGITIGVYGTVVGMIISLMKKARQMKEAMEAMGILMKDEQGKTTPGVI